MDHSSGPDTQFFEHTRGYEVRICLLRLVATLRMDEHVWCRPKAMKGTAEGDV